MGEQSANVTKETKVEMFVSGVNITSILYTMLPARKNSFCPA